MNMRKTKIICTLGPAVDHAETIERLIRTGMNAARFNFSHGSHAEPVSYTHLDVYKRQVCAYKTEEKRKNHAAIQSF